MRQRLAICFWVTLLLRFIIVESRLVLSPVISLALVATANRDGSLRPTKSTTKSARGASWACFSDAPFRGLSTE